jgi:protein-disulfide isomerase
VNGRRVLAAAISVSLLILGALILPSLHKTAVRVSPVPVAQTTAPSPVSTETPPVPQVPELSGLPSSALAVKADPAPQAGGLSDVDPHKAFGSKNAPVTMEVFSDFQCPACKALFTSTNRRLMDDYVSTGKVYLIHRDFPLAMHAYSRTAALYARAAADLGKVEPVEQALFQNQEKWEQTGDVDGTVAAVLSPAEMTKVRALVKGGTLEPLIKKDYDLGTSYSVNQTPTTVFHAKGQTYPFPGSMTYDVLKTFLDQLLSQK